MYARARARVCVCVCVCYVELKEIKIQLFVDRCFIQSFTPLFGTNILSIRLLKNNHTTGTQAHARTYIYIYIYIYDSTYVACSENNPSYLFSIDPRKDTWCTITPLDREGFQLWNAIFPHNCRHCRYIFASD